MAGVGASLQVLGEGESPSSAGPRGRGIPSSAGSQGEGEAPPLLVLGEGEAPPLLVLREGEASPLLVLGEGESPSSAGPGGRGIPSSAGPEGRGIPLLCWSLGKGNPPPLLALGEGEYPPLLVLREGEYPPLPHPIQQQLQGTDSTCPTPDCHAHGGLRKFAMSIRSLTNLYRCTMENILSRCITAWYSNCSAQDCKKLQKVCTARTITDANLPSMDSIYTARCCGKAANIVKDSPTCWRVVGEGGGLQQQQCYNKLDTASPQARVSRPGCLKEWKRRRKGWTADQQQSLEEHQKGNRRLFPAQQQGGFQQPGVAVSARNGGLSPKWRSWPCVAALPWCSGFRL
eukprot:g36318.t1